MLVRVVHVSMEVHANQTGMALFVYVFSTILEQLVKHVIHFLTYYNFKKICKKNNYYKRHERLC